MMIGDFIDGADLDRLAEILQSSGEYRVLKRLRATEVGRSTEGPTRRAVFLDVETTGLDQSTDTVIELAMLPFEYDPNGRVVAVGKAFVALRDPDVPIPSDVTALTGITDAMVSGRTIDAADVDRMVGDAAIIIAHNAGFDRPFCERLWPIFASKPWGCSWCEVDWKREGFEGSKLRDIAAGHGFFFGAHRAAEDCHAGVEILARRLPKSGRTALAVLLESARATRWRLWATGAPYCSREILKKRGYRWNPGTDGHPKAWQVDVSEQAVQSEREFLLKMVIDREEKIVSTRMTAFCRYSARV